jgi:ribose 5-phosphate isomerase B
MDKWGWAYQDVGTFSADVSVDYPDFVRDATTLLRSNENWGGVLVCQTGVGMSIAANRFPGIRAALCRDPLGAERARSHNDANVLVLGAGVTGPLMAEKCLEAFMKTSFEGGRHVPRLAKLERYGKEGS